MKNSLIITCACIAVEVLVYIMVGMSFRNLQLFILYRTFLRKTFWDLE